MAFRRSKLKLVCLAIGALALVANSTNSSLFAEDQPKNKLTPDELISSGRYSEIPLGNDAHGKALWAFAQYHLAPSGKVYDAALEAHKAGDILGTFIAWQCHQNGDCVRRDFKLMWKLHFEIRTRLEKKKDPSPVELFLLAHVDPVDAVGAHELTTNPNYKETEFDVTRRKAERMEKSAQGGFAQACCRRARKFQDAEDMEKAFHWYDKAIELGHAESMRCKGYLAMFGEGTKKDVKTGFALSVRSAERNDVFAMLNLAAYYDRGLGGAEDKKMAQEWLNKAAESGHWMGRMERGLARYKGAYGLPVDTKVADEDWRQAHALRSRHVLEKLAQFHGQGIGVERDGKRAAHFGEAAYVQGSSDVAEMLAYLYGKGVAGLEKDEKVADFWSQRANASFNAVFGLTGDDLTKGHPDGRLSKLDPWLWPK